MMIMNVNWTLNMNSIVSRFWHCFQHIWDSYREKMVSSKNCIKLVICLNSLLLEIYFLVKLADNGIEIKQLSLFKYLICFGNVSNKFRIVMAIYNLIEKLLEKCLTRTVFMPFWLLI